jgi:acetoin utilization protein AcuC
MRPERLRRTFDLLTAYDAFHGIEVSAPEPCPEEALVQIHSPQFVLAVKQIAEDPHHPHAHRFGFGSGDNPIFPGMYNASRLYTGASLQAAQAVVQGADIAMSISGGLHHAHFDCAAGFCIFNDCAVALRELRRRYHRVAYIDIDVHHGDGVQELFYSDPSVLTVSIHQSGRTLFPGTGQPEETGTGGGVGFSLNLPVWPGTSDAVWLHLFEAAAMPVLQAFAPGAVVLQLGTDAHFLDPLASVNLTAQGWLQAVRLVQSLQVPIVALGGGGYCPTTVPRMWAAAFGVLFNVPLNEETPPAFKDHNSIPALFDGTPPNVSPSQQSVCEQFSQAVLQEVKRSVFPIHGLS